MSKEDKRQRIIDASYKVFASKGYTNASILFFIIILKKKRKNDLKNSADEEETCF
ncbi:hypothetical protein [Bacillus thuringiensis]|uniref:hypothetical protein n=1 Tax=Bacillus thuringiensis TaxID=1428 RepID=UPI00159B9598|nr:hypothetical protein [Bacillus thuringiensis]